MTINTSILFCLLFFLGCQSQSNEADNLNYNKEFQGVKYGTINGIGRFAIIIKEYEKMSEAEIIRFGNCLGMERWRTHNLSSAFIDVYDCWWYPGFTLKRNTAKLIYRFWFIDRVETDEENFYFHLSKVQKFDESKNTKDLKFKQYLKEKPCED